MSKVMILPDLIASQIAAGEVVDRPAAVVKELVENAIDAGASQIAIDISSECRDIRVADNGSGMEPEDATLAFQRHATSKLRSVEDLKHLVTLGFRGEALPSIASVAKVTCLTRLHDQEIGSKVEVQDGNISVKQTGCAPGTVIEVLDLFYNVPARLKFLKKASTEFAHIHEIVQSLAVANPKIAMQLSNESEVVFKTTGSGNLKNVIVEAGLFSGRETLAEVKFVNKQACVTVTGYIAKPPHSRGDRKGILSLVNSRPVRCPLTYRALDYAFSDLIPKGKHPYAVICIEIDPELVDVNIHPTKKEIRYSRSNDVYLAIQTAVKEATYGALGLSSHNLERSQRDFTQAFTIQNADLVSRVCEEATDPKLLSLVEKQISLENVYKMSMAMPEQISVPLTIATPEKIAMPANWRVIGYIFNTYILLEIENELVVVEQHPAHERFVYEGLITKQNIPGRTSEISQPLALPQALDLAERQIECLRENKSSFESLGFDFVFKKNKVEITSIPIELSQKDYLSIVQTIIEQAINTEAANINQEAIKSLACQAAIKNGMPLSLGEIHQLLAQWNNCPRNDSCPHGRPTSLKLSKDKLFQLFHPN